MIRQDPPTRETLAALLRLEDFSPVYAQADRVRAAHVGDTVHIRAIVEFSSHCRRNCRYCGLNRCNRSAGRYRMTPEEIVDTAREAFAAGYRTLVMQSGEDSYFTPSLLADIIRTITATGMIVTVSCGEMPPEAYALLKEAGAARYLLKHETADPRLYGDLHPDGTLESRVACLRSLKALGFETGSGFMVGLPGQTADTLAQDLLLLRELSCDMAGIGPFIPHPDTPLRDASAGSPELTKRCVALARLLLPDCNLPATTALGVLNSREKDDVFSCGANVVMRKVTPDKYKYQYEIYPARLGPTDIPGDRALLEAQIRALDRIPL